MIQRQKVQGTRHGGRAWGNWFYLFGFVFCLSLGGVALAQEQDFAIGAWSLHNTETSSAGDFALAGSVGFPNAETMQNGEFTVSGGFLAGDTTDAPQARAAMYLPLVQR